MNKPSPRVSKARKVTKGKAFADTGPRPAGNVRRIEKIAEVIAREIVRDSRGLRPGTMLPTEAKLVERYRVSRASVREALRLLEVQGLIVTRTGPGGGPMLAEADSSHFGRMASLYFHLANATYRDTLRARLILEPVVAGIIAQEQNPQHIRALKEYLEGSKTTMEGSLPSAARPLSVEEERALEFHAMLMNMSGNPVLTLLVRSLQDLRADRVDGHGPHAEGEITRVHDMIARAIVGGRAAQAEQLMREHMEDFLQYELKNDPAYLEQIVSWR